MTFHEPNPTAAEKRARKSIAKAEAAERRSDELWERVREGRASCEVEAKRQAINAVQLRNKARRERLEDPDVAEEDHALALASGVYGEELSEPGEEDWARERAAPTMQVRARDRISWRGR